MYTAIMGIYFMCWFKFSSWMIFSNIQIFFWTYTHHSGNISILSARLHLPAAHPLYPSTHYFRFPHATHALVRFSHIHTHPFFHSFKNSEAAAILKFRFVFNLTLYTHIYIMISISLSTYRAAQIIQHMNKIDMKSCIDIKYIQIVRMIIQYVCSPSSLHFVTITITSVASLFSCIPHQIRLSLCLSFICLKKK